MVQTISGSIPSAELGRTLSHEHLTNGTPGMERIPGLLDRAEMIDRCLEALRQAHDAGIDSIIDLTPFDLGRQVWLFEAVAERSPLNVVCATGVYRWVPVVYYGFYEGRSFRKADVAASSGCGAPPGASRAPRDAGSGACAELLTCLDVHSAPRHDSWLGDRRARPAGSQLLAHRGRCGSRIACPPAVPAHGVAR